jgi:hypothetical protein
MEAGMILRKLALLGLVCLPLAAGCSSPGSCNDEQHPAPAFKLRNGNRLVTELGWFYADLQDVIFGVNYYCDMEHEFPTRIYD